MSDFSDFPQLKNLINWLDSEKIKQYIKRQPGVHMASFIEHCKTSTSSK